MSLQQHMQAHTLMLTHTHLQLPHQALSQTLLQYSDVGSVHGHLLCVPVCMRVCVCVLLVRAVSGHNKAGVIFYVSTCGFSRWWCNVTTTLTTRLARHYTNTHTPLFYSTLTA